MPRHTPKSAIRNPRSAIKRPIQRARWAAIRLFAMDVDGVLTNGTVQISSDGSETKSFSVLDGFGLKKLAQADIATAWISGRPSGATTVRANELKIPHVIQGRTDKHAALQELAGRLGLAANQCAYMGDDTLDAHAIDWAGIGVAPCDAMDAALAAADYVTQRPGGHGAVREICEHLLSSRLVAAEGSREKGERTERT
jgi:3-deoxy-D-manno-octulosonate 8-phosphate phosphatase (KDO 8-P phosphatase)